jgi:DNA-binding NtrC family response regulator
VTEKILLVDDETAFLDVVAERIEARGMTVATTDSAGAALALLAATTFDAVVLDLMMPGMDGLEALGRIKKRYPDLAVILLTGHATVEKGIEAMKLGALDVIEKPLDLDALTGIIKMDQARKLLIVQSDAAGKTTRTAGRNAR